MPGRNDCVIRALIERRAREMPDKVFALFDDESALTYGDLHDEVRRYAAGLQLLGVARGNAVVCWFPNGRQAMLVMLALNYLGAVYVPINVGYKGGLLEHVIRDSGARLIVAHGALIERLESVSTGTLERIVVLGDESASVDCLPCLALSELLRRPAPPLSAEEDIQPWDTLAIIYTSGTTGPSKGVACSSLHVYANYMMRGDARPQDRFLVTLPLFHMSGAGAVWCGLMRGGSIAMVEAFRTQEFWDKIRQFGITYTTLLGVMASFLLKAEPSGRDRDHPLQRVLCVPLSDQHAELTRRFGVEVFTAYNMTETSSPLFGGPGLTRRGTSGRPREGVEVRIVDEHDCEVPAGEVGELIVRTDMPFAMNHGYHNNAQATAAAWRNGWFHTGDAFRRDDEGYFYFVDRQKDALRRRGENVSSFEVEKEILAHPDVLDVAVVAVPSELAEDEILAVVCPVQGRTLDLPELVSFLVPRLAHFMVPRYFRIAQDLPRTSSAKVQKHLIREQGLAEGTWDRERHGIVLKSVRFDREKENLKKVNGRCVI
ncbi:AMP-binding protein [Alcaligenaceae bacterium]|nr:AMP-binding protein [Alcaligenaceae bacterium]